MALVAVPPALAPPALASRSPSLPATAGDVAFYAIFGVFVVAMVVLVVIVITWAVRHDVAGRRAWQARQQARARDDAPPRPPEGPS